MTKKSIFFILLALVVIAVVIVAYQWNKPHRTSEGEQPVASLTADNLYSEFETDEAKANATYLDKVVQVSGKVTQVTEEEGGLVVYLETSSLMGAISCTLVPGTKTTLKEGDQATLKGICKGFLTDVILQQSVVVEK